MPRHCPWWRYNWPYGWRRSWNPGCAGDGRGALCAAHHITAVLPRHAVQNIYTAQRDDEYNGSTQHSRIMPSIPCRRPSCRLCFIFCRSMPPPLSRRALQASARPARYYSKKGGQCPPFPAFRPLFVTATKTPSKFWQFFPHFPWYPSHRTRAAAARCRKSAR